jgi:aspartate kinase
MFLDILLQVKYISPCFFSEIQSNYTMIVMKFGGMSLHDAEGVQSLVEIVRQNQQNHPVVINSAMGKTTRSLLQIARESASGDRRNAQLKLESLRAFHEQIIEELFPDFSENDLYVHFNGFFDELIRLTDGVSVIKDINPRIQDKFLAYGELIATIIVTVALQQASMDAVWCDAREFVITDDRFTQAMPIMEVASAKIREKILPLVQSGKIPVIQGYIGSTREGATTTLGFEGSDFTASLVGASLDADDIQIWKNVPGVMTADPDIYPGAHTVKSVSYDEAEEITFFGAKVLHPSSIQPARKKNIPVHVLDSRVPSSAGTVLSREGTVSKNQIKSIAYRSPIQVLYIQKNTDWPYYDFFKQVFDVLDRERLTPYLVNIAERSMAVALSTSANLQHVIDDLSNVAEIRVCPGKATVSIIGQELANFSDALSRMVAGFKDVPIEMISQGASKMNITAVIDEVHVERVVSELHEIFFRDLDLNVFTNVNKESKTS